MIKYGFIYDKQHGEKQAKLRPALMTDEGPVTYNVKTGSYKAKDTYQYFETAEELANFIYAEQARLNKQYIENAFEPDKLQGFILYNNISLFSNIFRKLYVRDKEELTKAISENLTPPTKGYVVDLVTHNEKPAIAIKPAVFYFEIGKTVIETTEDNIVKVIAQGLCNAPTFKKKEDVVKYVNEICRITDKNFVIENADAWYIATLGDAGKNKMVLTDFD